MCPGSRPPTSGSPASSLPTPEGVAAGARDCRQRTTSLARAHGQEDAPRGQPSVAKPRDERVKGLEAMIRTKRKGNSVVVGGHVRPRGHRPRDRPRRVRAAPCPAARKPRGGCAFPRRGLGRREAFRGERITNGIAKNPRTSPPRAGREGVSPERCLEPLRMVWRTNRLQAVGCKAPETVADSRSFWKRGPWVPGWGVSLRVEGSAVIAQQSQWTHQVGRSSATGLSETGPGGAGAGLGGA